MPLPANVSRRLTAFIHTIVTSLPFGERVFAAAQLYQSVVSSLPFGDQVFAAAQIYGEVQNSRLWQLASTGLLLFGGSFSSFVPRTTFMAIANPFRLFTTIFLAVVISLASVSFIMINIGVAFHPLCEATSLSGSQFCQVVASAHHMSSTSNTRPYSNLFDNGTQVLSDVIQGNAIVSTTSVDLSRAHLVIDDLLLLVQYSTLSRKDQFLKSLEKLRAHAREAGFRLQHFASLLDGSMDRIIFANDHLHAVLKSRNMGLTSLVHDSVCSAIGLANVTSICPSSATFEIERRYKHALLTFEEELKELTLEAFNLMGLLKELDEELWTMLQLAKAERSDVIVAREIIQSQILTVFGFNKRQLADFEEAIGVLERVTAYTALARNHVETSHSQLYKLQEEVISTRSTVAKGAKIEWIPVVDSAVGVANGIERLQRARAHARNGGGLSLRAEHAINV